MINNGKMFIMNLILAILMTLLLSACNEGGSNSPKQQNNVISEDESDFEVPLPDMKVVSNHGNQVDTSVSDRIPELGIKDVSYFSSDGRKISVILNEGVDPSLISIREGVEFEDSVYTFYDILTNGFIEISYSGEGLERLLVEVESGSKPDKVLVLDQDSNMFASTPFTYETPEKTTKFYSRLYKNKSIFSLANKKQN